jgi:hypothetical protein
LFNAIGAVAAEKSNEELFVIVAREKLPPPLASVVTNRAAVRVLVEDVRTDVIEGRLLGPQSEQVDTG